MASQVTTIEPPAPDPFNIQHVKSFVFNETGNIMMASTDSKSDTIQQSVRDVFNEVSVFFAAMTKAISQTINPHGTRDASGKLPYYSLYNYDALESIIDGSGYFVHITQEDIQYKTESVGVNFSKELFEAVLGLASGSGALAFASAMIASMGKEGLNIESQTESRTNKVGNIVFVCEYLLGMPIVSALVITVEDKLAAQQLKVGPCFSTSKKSTEIVAHKDAYMFVTPTFIRQFAKDLATGANDPSYLSLIMALQSLVERIPLITGVWDVTNPVVPPVLVEAGATLAPTKTYAVFGQYLGQKTGQAAIALSPGAANLSVTESGWDDAGIKFAVANTGATDVANQAIQLTLAEGAKLSTANFTIGH
jgi:hypothetical protein